MPGGEARLDPGAAGGLSVRKYKSQCVEKEALAPAEERREVLSWKWGDQRGPECAEGLSVRNQKWNPGLLSPCALLFGLGHWDLGPRIWC